MKINKCDIIKNIKLDRFKDELNGFIRYKEDVSISITTYPTALGTEYAALVSWKEELR